jgi:7-cyano-7-deazaguanine synthase
MAMPALAVLTSGGLDSAILLVHQAKQHSRARVHPLYIRSDLVWEAPELDHLRHYLDLVRHGQPNIGELVILHQPTADLYGRHWSTTGDAVPDETTPDEAVYLPGRNLLLTLKALLWCHLHAVQTLALGVLASNRFPDASPAFCDAFAGAVGVGVADAGLRIVTPFGGMHKTEVMGLGRGLPLEWSFSCIRPVGRRHCGRCNKCAERKKAFRDAGLDDPTPYAS